MATYLDYAGRDGERPERWPNLREAATKPWMGQTAVIGRRPWLVVGFDGEMYELENEFGDRMRSNKFEVLEYESNNNRLVAASRIDGSPLDVGFKLAACNCAIGPIDFNRESYEWSVLTDEGNVIDIEARIAELEDADWKLVDTLKEAELGDPIPDLKEHEYYCPHCGSGDVDFGDNIAFCENCGWHGSQDEVLTDHDRSHDYVEDSPRHDSYDDSDWQYAGHQKEAVPEKYKGIDDPGHPKHMKGAPDKVSEIYNACMREGRGRGDSEEEKKSSCAAIAWSTYEKEKKSRTLGAEPGTRFAKIVQEGGKFCVKSEDGSKNLGCEDTMEAAKKRLQQVEYFKHKGALAMDDLGFKFSEYHYIKKEGDKWCIWQKGTGKTLSCHDSEEKAEAAFRGMEMHMHGDYAGEGISDRKDNPKGGPLKCPECGSHTVELKNSEDSEFNCKSCGNVFKHDIIKNPKAPKQHKGGIGDYEHWNEEAPRVWYEEEGKHPYEPEPEDPEDYERNHGAEDAAWEELYEAMQGKSAEELQAIASGDYKRMPDAWEGLPYLEHLDPSQVQDLARDVLSEMGGSGQPFRSKFMAKRAAIFEISDSDGKPVSSGSYYNLHGDKYKIPDVIKILEIKDGHIIATVEDNSTPLKISAEDITSNGYSFEPLPIHSSIEKHDLREAVSWEDVSENLKTNLGWDNWPNKPRNNADLTDIRERGSEYTFPTPSGGTLWVRENSNHEVTGWSVPDFNGGPGKWSSRDLEKIQQMVDEARIKSMGKTARRAFTPGEQKKLIEEKGNARNKDKLRLDDSHYTESKIEDDVDFLF